MKDPYQKCNFTFKKGRFSFIIMIRDWSDSRGKCCTEMVVIPVLLCTGKKTSMCKYVVNWFYNEQYYCKPYSIQAGLLIYWPVWHKNKKIIIIIWNCTFDMVPAISNIVNEAQITQALKSCAMLNGNFNLLCQI